MPHSTILFDLDGTLTDPRVGIEACIRFGLERVGRPMPEADLRWCIGPPLLQSFEALLDGDGELAKVALAAYRERFGDVGLFENELYTGITECLSSLTVEGYRCYVATSKPTVYAKRIVEHFGLAPFFREVYGSELDGTRADKRDLIRHIVDREELVAEETLMVGDRKHDVLGASVSGIKTIGVLYGYGAREELLDAGAISLCDSPPRLPSLIRESESRKLPT